MPVLAEGVTLSDAALTQIVIQAAESVDGARVRRPRRGLDVSVDSLTAHVEIELAARHGAVLNQLGLSVQREVAGALRTMCGVDRATVDVAIEELE
jgi:uncharacterized alkaline shock family protein YloU